MDRLLVLKAKGQEDSVSLIHGLLPNVCVVGRLCSNAGTGGPVLNQVIERKVHERKRDERKTIKLTEGLLIFLYQKEHPGSSPKGGVLPT